jgi:hypothetical protein
MDTRIRTSRNKGQTIIIICFLSTLSSCNNYANFNGWWTITAYRDKIYNPPRHPSNPSILIDLDNPKHKGSFPCSVEMAFGGGLLIDYKIFKQNKDLNIVLKFDKKNDLFSDTFKIRYLEKDSFFLESKSIQVKCNRMIPIQYH